MRKTLLLLLKSIVTLMVAIILGCIVIPLGLIYHLGYLLLTCRFKFFIEVKLLLIEIINVISYLFMKISIAINILGNVTSGELIEDLVTNEVGTLYGKSGVTISAATGKLEVWNKLNPKGVWLTRVLSKVFENNHSVNSYEYYKAENALKKRIASLE